jgi:putative transposase
MITLLLHLLRLLPVLCGGHCQVALENLALRHQLAVYKKTVNRPKLRSSDRLFWVALSRVWAGWRQALVIASPNTVLRWNLGIEVAERTIPRLLTKRRTPPSQTWRTFLANHVRDLVSIDFFTVPAAGLRVLFVLVVLAHHRRRVVHFNITEHPTAHWTAQQIVDAFPNDTAPSYLLRDRDQVYGDQFRHRVKGMRIDEVLTTPHSPWQNPFVERLIGSVRRECLDHIVVLGERHLRRILTAYFAYYHRARTHLSLDKDAPDLRPVEGPEVGRVVPLREVGGHRYVRRAA